MVDSAADLPSIQVKETTAYRLVNSKFPPIDIFDDVADAEEFRHLHALQALTNPRLQNEAGELNLLPTEEIPFGIPGCSYAVAPFTHVNPNGSRFSDGRFGVLYLADHMDTAIREVSYHQQNYWRGVEGLSYDRFVFRGLTCRFAAKAVSDATVLPPDDPIYDPNDYTASRAFGLALRMQQKTAIQYHSVRRDAAICWGLFTPQPVTSIVQNAHYELIWDGRTISSVNRLAAMA